MALPTMLSSTEPSSQDVSPELKLSRFESVFMLLCYALFLVFQLCTHRHLYEEDVEKELADPGAAKRAASSARGVREVELAAGGLLGDGSSGGAGGVLGRKTPPLHADVNGDVRVELGAEEESERVSLIRTGAMKESVEEDDEEERVLSLPSCLLWLTMITLLISLLSDYIMKCIKDASIQLKIPMPFLTTIVVPIVGNAAEHASAIMFAMKNRMEISLGVAVGSSTQISVLVMPFCVVLAWIMGRSLDLNFNEFEAMVYFISVLLVAVVVQDATSNWLKGAMLVITYCFISAAFWVHKDRDLTDGVEALR